MPPQRWRWLLALALPILLWVGDVRLTRISSQGDAPTIALAELPLRFGRWRGTDQAVVSKAVAPLARDAVVQRLYVRDDGAKITLALIYSNKWEGLHPPEQCMVANGWKVVRETTVDLTYGTNRTTATGNIVTAAKEPDGRMVELYLFADASKTTSTWVRQYMELLTRHGRSGGQASCLVLVANERRGREDDGDSVAIVRQFAQDFLPYVHASLAQHDTLATSAGD